MSVFKLIANTASRAQYSKGCHNPAKISAVDLSGRLPLINVKVGEDSCISLLDSGATKSLISKTLLQKIKNDRCVKGVSKISNYLKTANQTRLPVRQEVKLHIKIDNYSWDFNFWVANEIPFDMVLGYDFFHFSKLKLNMASNTVKFNYGVNNEKILLLLDEDNLKPEKMQFGEADMTEEMKTKFNCLLKDYGDVVTNKIGKAKVPAYQLRVNNDIKPFRMRPFQMTPDKVRAMREIIDELLENGVIEKSQSEYSSNCFLVPKRDKGKYRLVNNYKTLNQYIEMDSFPSPIIDTMFQYLQNAKFFTSIDLVHSFFQIELSKNSRKYTAFNTSFGSYQWVRIPQGLKIGTQALNRVVDTVLGDLKFRCVINFCDDVLVYSPDAESHYRDLKAVLQRLREYHLTINPEKIRLAKRGVQFLGHYVAEGKLHIDPSRTEPVKNYPVPKNVKQVQRFVGFASFYSKFIPNFSELCYPLNRLKRKGVKFKWTKTEQNSFDKLIEALTSHPVLHLPDFSKKFILNCDASDHSVGCVLQQQWNGGTVVIGYTSRALTKSEQGYSIYKKELLACLWGCEKYREFLLEKPFILRTDNQAITYLWKSDKTTGQLARWKMRLSEFPCEIEHARATQNIPADALSRLFEPEVETELMADKKPATQVVHFLQNFPEVFHDIAQKQRGDKNLKEIIAKLEKGSKVKNYLLRNGVLKYQKNQKCAPKICVPDSLKPMILKFNHDISISVHWGIKKTTAKIAKDFAWKNMFEDIKNYVRSCEACQLHKTSQNSKVGLMNSTVPQRRMQRLHIDLFGPLVRSKNGNQYMLVCVDSFSKFTWFVPLKRATSDTVKRALLERVFAQNGVPEVIISDNGSQFTSGNFRSFLFGLGVKHYTTSVAHPQGNQSERENRNLKYALKIFHSKTQHRWDENLNYLMIGINSAHHISIGMTPAMALMGRELNNPLKLAWNLVEETEEPVNWEDKVKEIVKNLTTAQQKMKAQYDKTRRPSPFNVGDLVLYRIYIPSDKAKGVSNKLSQGWKGPWVITDVINGVNVKIKLLENEREIKVVHVSQLKRFYTRE